MDLYNSCKHSASDEAPVQLRFLNAYYCINSMFTQITSPSRRCYYTLLVLPYTGQERRGPLPYHDCSTHDGYYHVTSRTRTTQCWLEYPASGMQTARRSKFSFPLTFCLFLANRRATACL